MKQTAVFLMATFLMAACTEKMMTNDEFSMLKAEKDSLKEIKSTIGTRLAEIELRITELDTTKTLTLITTATPSVGSFNHYFQVYGSLSSDQNAQIFPEMAATITSIDVKEGQDVSKGQIIAKLNIQTMRKQEEELKTRLELAETTFQKQKKLWDQKIGSEIQYLQTKNNRDALKNSIDVLKSTIAKGNITAPFSGVIDEIFPKSGEMAMPGMPIVRLLNLTNMYIEADISESYVGKVKKGDEVIVNFPVLGINKVSTIERIGQFINPNNRTLKIRVNIDNSNNELKPNMVALININDFKQDSAVIVASSLIMEGANEKSYVFVVENKQGVKVVKKQPVKVEMSYKGESLISSGLKGTEVLVDKGARSIRNGEMVQIQE